jgi:predicted Rossmann fold nucleotide-binding protein DprA/Smf involved in DNA uptake
MVVPSSPWVSSGRGSNLELAAGGLLVQSAKDVLETLERLQLRARPRAPSHMLELPFDSPESSEQLLLRAVHAGARHVDDIAQETQLDLAQLQAALLTLRLAGKLSVDPTGQISLATP